MRHLLSTTALALLLATGSAFAAEDVDHPNTQPSVAPPPASETVPQATTKTRSSEMIGTLPSGGVPISDYYKQSVYDTRDNKIGDVKDLLLDESGKINAVIIGVGGFLGMGEKNVAVPFSSLKVAEKNGDRYLVMETTKEALQTAPGYTFDETKKVWVPAMRQG
jgi:sporulation protein YlmC with PRC-barrel domain